jgi:hypothetical protein
MKINLKEHWIEFNNGIIISWWENLSDLWMHKKYNWNTFTLLHLEIENDFAMHEQEITIGFLCMGVRIRWQIISKEEYKIHKQVCDSIKKLNQSCYGWVNKEWYENFRTKKVDVINVSRIRLKGYRKKIFLQ